MEERESPAKLGDVVAIVAAIVQSFTMILWVGAISFWGVSLGLTIALMQAFGMELMGLMFTLGGVALLLWVNQIMLVSGGVGLLLGAPWAPSIFRGSLTWNIGTTIVLTVLTVLGLNFVLFTTASKVVVVVSAALLLLPLCVARYRFRA